MALLNNNPNAIIDDNSEAASNTMQKSIFVKNNIPSLLFRKRQKQSIAELPKIRILPCFDFRKYGSADFQSSWVPFKNEDQTQFTQWAIPVKGYTFFGALWEHFLSPATMQSVAKKYADKFTDPIADLSSFIRLSVKYNRLSRDGMTPLITHEEELLASVPKESGKFVVIPMKPRQFLMLNALVENKATGQWEQKALIITGQTYKLLTEILEVKTGRRDPIVSEAFPDNLYGDITDPAKGCILTPVERPSDTGLSMLTLSPSIDCKTLTGYTPMPVTDQVLNGRFLLNDPDNVLDIWDYQKIVDQMCMDPAIPLELLEKCLDNGGFAEGTVLNTELRAIGEQRVAERDAAIEAFKKDKAPSSMSNPSFVTNKQVAPNYSQTTNYAPAPSNPVMESLKQTASTPTTAPVMEAPTITTAPSQPQQASGLTPEEQAEYAELGKLTQTGMFTPDKLARYMELMRKASNIA